MENKIKSSKGFTIIEVLIVLAIAGLIMLIVFLAIPALQRNSRNTQRRSDAANLLSGVNEYVANNKGTLPAGLAGAGSTATIGTSGNTVDVKLGFYSKANVSMITVTNNAEALAAQNANTMTIDTVQILKGGTCNGNAARFGSSKSVAVIYEGEPSGKFCIAS